MINANFSELQTGDILIINDNLWQYDTGQQLRITGISGLSETTEVHFGLKYTDRAIVKTGEYQDNALTVDIPNLFLEYADSTPAKVWVHIRESESAAKTILEIHIPIIPRERPDDYISPEDIAGGTALQTAVNSYLDAHPEQYTGYTKAETEQLITHAASLKESLSHKVTEITANSTDAQYPSAKAVYTMAEILKKRMASTKDYGFVGDGTEEDTARLQCAIDENSVLYIPKRSDNKPYYLYTPDPNPNNPSETIDTVTYPTHDCITISHPIVLFGDGIAKTILMIKHQDRDDDYKNNIGGAVIKINNGNKVVIRDLAIYGIKGTGNPPGKKDGIVIDNSNSVVIENVEFKQLNNDGIRILSNCNGSFFNNLHITECGRNGLFQAGHGNCFSNIYAHHNYNGLFLESGGGQVTNVRTGENKGNGMVLHRAVAFLINNVESQQNKLNGLLMLNDYYGSTYASEYGRVWPCRGNIISNFQCFGNNYRTSNSEANAGASGFVIAGMDNVIQGNDIPCRNLAGTWIAFEQSSVKISSPYTTNNIIDITQSFGFDGDRYDLELNADNNFNEFKSVDSVVPLEVNEIKINGNRVTENNFKSSIYSSRAVSTYYYSSRPGIFDGVKSTVSANTLTISQGASGYIDSNNVYQKLLRNLDQIRTNSSGIETAITRRTSQIVDGEVEYTDHEGIIVMPLFRMANSTKVAPFSINTYYCDDSENEHVPAGAARIFLKLKYRVTPNNPSAYGKWGIYTIVQAIINGADPEQLNPYVSEVKNTCCYSGEYLERYFVYDFSHLAANENISIDHIAVNLCFAKLASGDDITAEPDAVGFEMPEIKFAYGSGSLTQLEAASGVTAPSFVYP